MNDFLKKRQIFVKFVSFFKIFYLLVGKYGLNAPATLLIGIV